MRHLPDGVLLTPEKTAIEVELTLKSRRRLEQIVLDVGIAYDQVWYFAAPRLVPVLRELAAAAPYSNVIVHRYPPRAADFAGAARRANPTHRSRAAARRSSVRAAERPSSRPAGGFPRFARDRRLPRRAVPNETPAARARSSRRRFMPHSHPGSALADLEADPGERSSTTRRGRLRSSRRRNRARPDAELRSRQLAAIVRLLRHAVEMRRRAA